MVEGVPEREDPRGVNVLVVRHHRLKLLLELLEVRTVARARGEVHHADRAQNTSVRYTSAMGRRGSGVGGRGGGGGAFGN